MSQQVRLQFTQNILTHTHSNTQTHTAWILSNSMRYIHSKPQYLDFIGLPPRLLKINRKHAHSAHTTHSTCQEPYDYSDRSWLPTDKKTEEKINRRVIADTHITHIHPSIHQTTLEWWNLSVISTVGVGGNSHTHIYQFNSFECVWWVCMSTCARLQLNQTQQYLLIEKNPNQSRAIALELCCRADLCCDSAAAAAAVVLLQTAT